MKGYRSLCQNCGYIHVERGPCSCACPDCNSKMVEYPWEPKPDCTHNELILPAKTAEEFVEEMEKYLRTKRQLLVCAQCGERLWMIEFTITPEDTPYTV